MNFYQVWDFFNSNSGLVTALSTVILVLATGIYAYFTFLMARIMRKQVVANIQISNLVVRSDLSERWAIDRLLQKDKNSYFSFDIYFDLRNKSSGNGSIDKPTLLLKFANHKFVIRLAPKTKIYKTHPISSNTYEKETVDLGGTIFIRGGEALKIELEYNLHNIADEAWQYLESGVSSMEYYISFTDNLDRRRDVKINTIQAGGHT